MLPFTSFQLQSVSTSSCGQAFTIRPSVRSSGCGNSLPITALALCARLVMAMCRALSYSSFGILHRRRCVDSVISTSGPCVAACRAALHVAESAWMSRGS
eukprot:scaffold1738_cov73-Phaeocystis_antarctica.AAC.7